MDDETFRLLEYEKEIKAKLFEALFILSRKFNGNALCVKPASLTFSLNLEDI